MEAELTSRVARVKEARENVLGELKKVIVGQDQPMEQLLTAMFAGGHCLIQGPLASAKTILATSIAQVMDLDFRRIQFTPDLMPSDISGTEILEEDTATGHRVVRFVQGPVFTNVLMADEINRTPPKTQAALLEVMQERQVTLGGKTTPLPEPFFVLATQVSIEQEGTYPLPEAQQDRFMLSVRMDYLSEDQEVEVVRASTGAEVVSLDKVISGDDLLGIARTVQAVRLPEALGVYIVDLVAASRPTVEGAPDFVKEYVVWGAGLRASQNIALASKSMAAQNARVEVTLEDIRRVIVPVMRHRISLSFRADIDKLTVEGLVRRLLEAVPEPR
jgi:MoxR-like ATPase